MTSPRYLLGLLLAVISFVPVGVGVHSCRKWVLGELRQLEGMLADIVGSLTVVLVICELLGAVGLFRIGAVVPLLVVIGTSLTLVARRNGDRRDRGSPGVSVYTDDVPEAPRWQVATAGAVVALVAGSWISRVHLSFRSGMTAPDALWYHLPTAASFVQSGQMLSIKYFESDPTTAFYPFNTEVFHALGMMLFGSDLASIFVNMAWFSIALAAAWSIGRHFGVAPVTTIGIAILLGTPGMVSTQPGQPLVDVSAFAMFLTAIAFFSVGRDVPRSRSLDVLVALAGGLAIGMKYTFMGPVVLLCFCQLATTARGRRLGRAGLIVFAATATGAFWFVRNLIAIGSPLPSAKVKIGAFSLSSLTGEYASSTTSVSKYLFQSSSWRSAFIPGFRASWGPAWPLILTVLVLGMAAVVSRHTERRVRALAALSVGSVAVWLFTPQILGAGKLLIFFGVNLRYALPAAAVCFLVVAIVGVRWRGPMTLVFALAAVVTQSDPTSWPDHLRWGVIQDRSLGTDARYGLAAAVVVFGIWLLRMFRPNLPVLRSGPRLAGCIVAVLAVALIPLRGPYLRNWYRDYNPMFDGAFAWARTVHGVRIAIAPQTLMQLQYPLYNRDLSNKVQMLAVRHNDELGPPTTCREWMGLLREGKYQYVFLYTGEAGAASSNNYSEWTLRVPGVDPVVHQRVKFPLDGRPITVVVYHLPDDLTASTC